MQVYLHKNSILEYWVMQECIYEMYRVKLLPTILVAT